ncbi:hypothetical protein [Actinoallomurus sp. CA-142502]
MNRALRLGGVVVVLALPVVLVLALALVALAGAAEVAEHIDEPDLGDA